jgi:hypothetical protein
MNTPELQQILRAVERAYNYELTLRAGLFAEQGAVERILWKMYVTLEQYSLQEVKTRRKRKGNTNA